LPRNANDWTQLPPPCNGESAYEGFGITMAMLRSVVQRGQIQLTPGPGKPLIEALGTVLPEQSLLVSCDIHRKEYNVELAAYR
jgi:hypothetical protein